MRTQTRARRAAAKKPILESTVTCPYCGFAESGTMPLDACVYFHECGRCKAILRPKSSGCCVFCSFGSVSCPSEQKRGG
jgi:transcription elongation factor Elf1